jgi:hypothetical protein
LPLLQKKLLIRKFERSYLAMTGWFEYMSFPNLNTYSCYADRIQPMLVSSNKDGGIFT